MRTRLRVADAGDIDILFRIYASSRTDDLPGSLLRMQFDAQDKQFRAAPGAEFWVIHADETPIGRLYLQRLRGEVRIMDITLLPEWRGDGIGSGIIEHVQARAIDEGAIVTLHVAFDNPAQRLYERLGFTAAGGDRVYRRLVWSQENVAS